MTDESQDLVAFLGVSADNRLLDEDRFNLADVDQYREPVVSSHRHDRLVAVGSLLTGTTLIGGGVMVLYGGWQALFNGGGAIDIALAVIGLILVGTHWGWVHVAEYLGLTIDERQQRATDERRRDWLGAIEPYPRLSISTGVLADASTRIERIMHKPVLTEQHTFTFVRTIDAAKTFEADVPAEVIAATVEAMRREARLETDHLRELWEAASSAYDAALFSADDNEQRLAAQRAAATALSEHINASLLEPPLVE
jgi:hypothetical protein